MGPDSPIRPMQAALTQLDGEKVGRQGFASAAEAEAAAQRIRESALTVAALTNKV